MYENITSKLLLVLLVVVIGGCDSNPPIKPTDYNLRPNVVVKFTKDFSNIRELYGDNIVGLTMWINGKCIMYIPPLADVYDDNSMCIIGHEFMHCVLGYFHAEDESESCY